MYYLSSFRIERIGTLTITWSGTDVSVTSGHYCHVTLASYASTCTAFAAALQAALVTAGFASATVSYSTTTHAYTLSNGGGSFAIAFTAGSAGTRMARVLGFTTGATATSHTSTVRPYYVIVPQHDGRSRYPGLRDEERTVRRRSDAGLGLAIGPSTSVVTAQWEHWFETLASTFEYAASSSAPWTWEHFWRHAGRWQEYVLIGMPSGDTEPRGVWQLTTPDFAQSTHERQFADGNFAWKIRFSGTRLASV